MKRINQCYDNSKRLTILGPQNGKSTTWKCAVTLMRERTSCKSNALARVDEEVTHIIVNSVGYVGSGTIWAGVPIVNSR